MEDSTAPSKPPLSIADPRHIEAVDFLMFECELLDDYNEREWLRTMVSPDIAYQVPVRETVERARGNGFTASTFHLNETLGSLDSRVARGETKYAWAEDPPSRVRHFITNIRTREHEDGDHLLRVKSNVLIYRTRQEQTTPQMLSGERDDILRREDGRWRLLKRVVYLDLTVIGTHNLSLFF
ncbi:aromatic-ring-hydroxylating dioxygenase subunit beta [Gordonia rubripertincta]|uniref:aromatic-ring-hydroxylating dioxygenase subunit beta n=1 Tax=Gordonia rubripertincta TaxID=36822 RepID=UPI0015FDEEBF|nr:3-phenylpropionate/cinnamic acid dioxygenase subunit beta [Gordonia rubripertincta]QMU22902.1 3-phenylpropionate/cinnamic acid dioxygenase subunit beta [Gordonia rubripertincta]